MTDTDTLDSTDESMSTEPVVNDIITQLKSGRHLSRDRAYRSQQDLLKGRIDTDELVAIFNAFEKKDLTSDELLGFFRATRDAMVTVQGPKKLLDTAGTGGDGLNTFNISTVAALVCAAAGVPVAKHGNRSASSNCGSADVLEELGVKIYLNKEHVERCLDEIGIGFMFAPLFHPSLKHAAQARQRYGKRTYFNFIGPMLNPAGANHQIIGVADDRYIELMGKALLENGSERVWLVHGHNRMDEISPTGPNTVVEYSRKQPDGTRFEIDPTAYGFEYVSLEKLTGGSPAENARIVRDLLSDQAPESHTSAVILNAAAGLTIYGKSTDFKTGIRVAQKTLASGKAKEKFEALVEVSNRV